MKIGVIGPDSSCQMIMKSLKEINHNLEVNCYVEEQVNACDKVIERCEKECDAILFTGCAIESFVTEVCEIKKPHTSVEKSALSVASALLEMQKKNMELDAFSIDIVENQVVEDILDAFHILARNIYSCSFRPGVEEQKYVDWHISLLRAMVRLALERLENECALQEAEYAQAAVEIFQLTNYKRSEGNYYSSMLEKTEIEKEIIKYTKGIQGAMFAFGRREYIVFSTAGAVKDKTNQYKLSNLQRKVADENKIQLNIGMGMGVTANQAEMNARHALEYSLKYGRQEIYYIDARQTLHGPIGTEAELEYQLISSDPKFREISEKTGLSINSILKIIAIAEVRQSYIFDAHQLAECLNVTVRSARRIMNKIREAGYGKLYAKESTAAGGRPKALVEILFKR